MSDKNMEMMKKILEAKRQKSSKQGNDQRPQKNIGGSRKAVRNGKTGGLFDK